MMAHTDGDGFYTDAQDAFAPASRALVAAIQGWQAGQLSREEVVRQLSGVPQDAGEQVQQTLALLLSLPRPVADLVDGPEHSPAQAVEDTDSWRSELLASRARTWSYPFSCGLLVSPHVLILTDGQQGVILRQSGLRPLPASTSGSLLLLCQTIVMAQSAVDEQEVGKLRQQRIESTSTSLSEIEPIRDDSAL